LDALLVSFAKACLRKDRAEKREGNGKSDAAAHDLLFRSGSSEFCNPFDLLRQRALPPPRRQKRGSEAIERSQLKTARPRLFRLERREVLSTVVKSIA
jgi:hypothetical protein